LHVHTRLSVAIAVAVLGAGLGPVGRPAAAGAAGACPPRPPVTAHRITSPRWVSAAVVTEYYPIREAWFTGKLMSVPGLPGRHRVDWLYGPNGVAMNGEGVGVDDRFYHFAGPYSLGWVDAAGRSTRPCWNGTWTSGAPAWLAFGWRNRRGQVTFPLARGGWSNDPAARYLRPPAGLRFAAGRTRPLPFWHTVAVDPKVIPLGSRVFIPAYCDTPAHGWFHALDTGGAIIAFHLDVYRRPPATLELRSLRGQRVYVVPPDATLPQGARARCR
jgi:3D (Asp-Asp-Asp) domain-containing protein